MTVFRWIDWFRLSGFGWSEPMLLPPRDSDIKRDDADAYAFRENVPPWYEYSGGTQ